MGWIETSTGIVLPAPEMGSSGVTITTLVNAGRNTGGSFVGQPIGDDKLKITISFRNLTNDQIKALLLLFDRKRGGSFVNKFRVFDPRVGDFVYLDMYVGDRTGTPMLVDATTFRPSYWKDVKANLIEV